MKKQFEVKIIIPEVPKHIKYEGQGRRIIPISEFTKEELEQIGIEWTVNLIKKSQEHDTHQD